MIPDRDYFADRNGKLTDDPTKWAFQVGVKGVNLDDRIARRYGITDMLVSVDEPKAPRRLTGRNESSVKISKAEEQPQETEEPQEPAEAEEPKTEEPEVEKPKAEVKKPAAKKGEKTK